MSGLCTTFTTTYYVIITPEKMLNEDILKFFLFYITYRFEIEYNISETTPQRCADDYRVLFYFPHLT